MKKFILTVFTFVVSAACFAAKDGRIVVSSYPWQKVSIVDMLKDVKAMGVDKISMFQNMKLGGGGKYSDVKFHYAMPSEARAEAKKIFDDANVRVVSIGHIYLSDEAEIKKLFDFAKYFGIEVMTVEAPPDTLDMYEKYSGQYGIGVGLYNHPHNPKNEKLMKRYPYTTPEKMAAAVENRRHVRGFPDCGHWGRSGFDIVSCVRKMKGKMLAVNIQNLSADGNCEEYSKGRLPLKDFVAELKKQKFDGYCIVMFNVAPDRSQIEKVAPSVEFLERCGIKK